MFLTHNQRPGPGIPEGASEVLEEVPVVYEGDLGVHYVVPGVHEGLPRRFQRFMRGYGFSRGFHGFMAAYRILLRGFQVFRMGFEVFRGPGWSRGTPLVEIIKLLNWAHC